MISPKHTWLLALGLLVAACGSDDDYIVPSIPWWPCTPGDILGCEGEQQTACTAQGRWQAASCASICAEAGLPEPARCEPELGVCVCGVLADDCTIPGLESCDGLVLLRCDASLRRQPIQDCSTACAAQGFGTPTCSVDGCRCDLLSGACPPDLEGLEVCDAGSGEGGLPTGFRRCIDGVWQASTCPWQDCVDSINTCIPTDTTTIACECR